MEVWIPRVLFPGPHSPVPPSSVLTFCQTAAAPMEPSRGRWAELGGGANYSLSLSQDDCEDFEDMGWYEVLMFYGFREGEELDPSDPDTQMLPEMIDRVIITKLTSESHPHILTPHRNHTPQVSSNRCGTPSPLARPGD